MLRIGRLAAALTVFGVFWSISAPARAQNAPFQRTFETNLFEPAIGPKQLFTVETARVPEHLGWGVGALLGYQNSSMSVYLVDSNDDLIENYPIVSSHITTYLYGFFGFLKRFQLSIGLPIYWQNQEQGYTDLQTDLMAINALQSSQPDVGGAQVGDLRIQFKGYIYGIQKKMHNLAASLTVMIPLWYLATKEEKFMGDRGAVIWPKLIYELRYRKLSAALNVGFQARTAKTTFLSTESNHAFTYGVGAFYKVATFGSWHMDILAELHGRTGLSVELDANPVEVDAGIRFAMAGGLSLLLGAGAGLVKAVGSPTFRIFLGVQYSPDWSDRDGDGIPDYKDKCPDQKEDKDGFEDHDGCPDLDNDKDGIPDDKDKCPNEPEDYDKFEDEDGCPDRDNDQDGIPDKQDNCPMDKGTLKNKGCPANMLDEDGDGIPDDKDKCPKEPEDKDGFQDEDGCPDPDNDQDGIPDAHDKCPNDAEDKDGFEDADGCPDPDNDGDGVCDDNPTIQRDLKKFRSICHGADKCPNKAETINGVDDLDGCPDAGKEAVKLDLNAGAGYKGRFLLTDRFQFSTDYGAELSASNKAVLTQLAHILRLRAARIITQVAIMTFTDATQSNDQAIAVTKAQAEAIRNFLISLGTEKSRLVAIPAGKTNPICSKRPRKRRRRKRCDRQNRRVELFILKLGR
ncbi:MAG: OmpA family protein [bacterium]